MLTVSAIRTHLPRTIQQAWHNRILASRPLVVMYTTPHGKEFCGYLRHVEWDATSYDERTGELGIWLCTVEISLLFDESAGVVKTMTRTVPNYCLRSVQ